MLLVINYICIFFLSKIFIQIINELNLLLDDVKLYEKAWDFSQNKSSKAQRHWGNYLFAHKQYQECIPHFQKSCEINSLQESVWLRLG